MSNEPKMLRRVQPFGRDCEYSFVNMGMTALAAAKIVIKPSTSVINSRVLTFKREPARTPTTEPAIIARDVNYCS